MVSLGSDARLTYERTGPAQVRALRAGLHVHEVPSFESKRVCGESNLHVIPDGLRVLRTIIHEYVRIRRGQVVGQRNGAESAK